MIIDSFSFASVDRKERHIVKVNKIIINKEQQELDIVGVTLLSVEEAAKLSLEIRNIDDWWWLCSPGILPCEATLVSHEIVDYAGHDVDEANGVRPALQISNLGDSNLKEGDKFKWGDYTWTIIFDQYALCDKCVALLPFREDSEAKDANVYEKSDIKKYLDQWYEDKKDNELLHQ